MKSNKSLSALLDAVNKAKQQGGSQREDKEFYYPARDRTGNGYAIIRFLPGKTEDDLPFVKTYAHGFKNDKNGKWLIEDCPTTIGETCPVNMAVA